MTDFSHMRSTGSWDPNNCTAITGAGNKVVLSKPMNIREKYKLGQATKR